MRLAVSMYSVFSFVLPDEPVARDILKCFYTHSHVMQVMEPLIRLNEISQKWMRFDANYPRGGVSGFLAAFL